MKFQIFFIQIALIWSRCAFTVDENGKPYEKDQEPFIIGILDACPFFNNQLVCCLPSQVVQMSTDYQSLDATFGSDGGGCDICGSNMKRFWCHYTCNPNQKDFIQTHGYKNMTDPRDATKIIEVQMITLTVHPVVACQVYSSCARTSFASQVSAMQTPGGFFSFQGEQAASGGGQFINVEFAERDSLLIEDIQECNNKYHETTIDENGITHYWDQFGYELKEPCGCNTCDLSCSADSILYEPPTIMSGFEGFYVLFAWGWALLTALGLTIYRTFMQKSEIVEESQNQKILP